MQILTPMRIAVAVVVAALLAGCSSTTEPLLPDAVYQQVASADRERNYDLAWQDIARLGTAIEQQDIERVVEESLLVVGRMARLHHGEARRLDDPDTAQQVAEVRERSQGASDAGNRRALQVAGRMVRTSFDEGDFDRALGFAIEAYGVAAELSQTRGG